ncbi:MAG: FAD-binding protein, partial [Flavobacteriales bacterium]|nr:FAD-binding protein [Flavobacteriales bacterium]
MNGSNFDVIIIGGGLAGLVSSIDLAQRGISVLVIEKNNFPLHKVCGEYLSNEVRPYLKRLGFVPENLGAKKISRFMISSLDGTSSTCEMYMGGFSISRYLLDKELFSIALNSGVAIVTDTAVTNVSFVNGTQFEVNTANKNYYAKVVLGAYGKRSNLDKEIRSQFFYKRTNYVGVKCHFKGDHEDDLVSLHNFEGGYCGISKIENGLLNISYLTTNNIVKRYKNTKELERFHLSKNPHLHAVFKNADSTFNKSLVISQINFGIKQTVEKH